MSVWKQNVYDGERFVRVAPGEHWAVMVAMIDLGDQPKYHNGKHVYWRQIYLCWEIVSGPCAGGLIGLSTFPDLGPKSKLREWISGRLGKPLSDKDEVDLAREIGQPCTLVVEPRGQYSEVKTMLPPPANERLVPRHRPTIVSIEDYVRKGVSIPNWLPKLFGEAIEDVVLQCKQVAGGRASQRPPQDSGNGHDPNGSADSYSPGYGPPETQESIPF